VHLLHQIYQIASISFSHAAFAAFRMKRNNNKKEVTFVVILNIPILIAIGIIITNGH
jgi:hypothetical protein